MNDITPREQMADRPAAFDETEFKELCSAIRHYSGIRYLIIPIFMAIHGAMFIALKDGIQNKINVSEFRFLVLAFPIVVGAIFLVLEYTLDRYLDEFFRVARTNWPSSFWAKVARTRKVVTTAISALYVVVTMASCVFLYAALKP